MLKTATVLNHIIMLCSSNISGSRAIANSVLLGMVSSTKIILEIKRQD